MLNQKKDMSNDTLLIHTPLDVTLACVLCIQAMSVCSMCKRSKMHLSNHIASL